ncbi:MAG TPA: NADH-quinone oxidoreductase subunit M, partial [Gemmataceae bacterium]|nr:NADH-quinone oxidoreductase subunit M [Gemmataceae bacterium]
MVDVPYSLVFMSALIFLPTLFAVLLLLPGVFSARRPEATRWWALLGTALTLVLSLCMLISYYYDVVQFHLSDPSGSLLTARAPQIDGTGGATPPTPSQTWVVRYPWI